MVAITTLSSSNSPCPVYFFIVDSEIYKHTPRELTVKVDYGNYILKNNSQFPPPFFLAKDTVARVNEVYHCAMFEAIVTDSPLELEPRIRSYIEKECKRLKPNPQVGDCVRPRFSENKVTSTIPMDYGESPTFSPTIRTIASSHCEDRPDQETCTRPNPQGTDCHWFNDMIGCHPVDYCVGLKTEMMCRSRRMYCIWKTDKCQSRSIKH